MAETELDPRGDLGAICDARWSGKWSKWGLAAQDSYFAHAATWPLFSVAQARDLLQGLPPQPPGWHEQAGCLAEFASIVDRYEWDVRRGALPPAITPEQLAAWCDLYQAALPDAFICALQKHPQQNHEAVAEKQSSVEAVIPTWAPHGMFTTTNPAPANKKRGRPSTEQPKYAAMIEAAVEILMSEARSGRTMTLKAIAKRISHMPMTQGQCAATIEARLKGKLPTQKAKRTAALACARSS